MTTPEARDQLEAIARVGGLDLGKLRDDIERRVELAISYGNPNSASIATNRIVALIQPELDTLLATLSSKDAEIMRLREILKPFGDEADAWTDTLPDDYVPVILQSAAYEDGMASDYAKFSLGDLRRARAALTNPEQVGGTK